MFGGVVFGLLALDLFRFHSKNGAFRSREALLWSIVWIVVALVFNGLVYFQFGTERGFEFLTGYLIEKALAVDNLFVFALIFSYFGIPPHANIACCSSASSVRSYFRAVFIAAGASLLAHFDWLAYLFGAFLAFTRAETSDQDAATSS